MKNISIFKPIKYNTEAYKEVEENIYHTVYFTHSDHALTLREVTDQDLLKELKKLKKWFKGTREYLDDDLLLSNYEGHVYYKDPEDDEEIIYYNTEDYGKEIYVTSFKFEPEPELNENLPKEDISQYPLEDLLEKYYCMITDDYVEENNNDPIYNYFEAGSDDIDDIRGILSIIGKHVYNKEEGQYIKLVID